MATDSDLKTLILKYISGEISPEEKKHFYDLIEEEGREAEFKSIMRSLYENQAATEDNDAAWETMVRSILEHKAPVRKIALYKKNLDQGCSSCSHHNRHFHHEQIHFLSKTANKSNCK